MALAWKAGWVNRPRGFESRILRQTKHHLTTGNADQIRSAGNSVPPNFAAASLSFWSQFRRQILLETGLPKSTRVIISCPRLESLALMSFGQGSHRKLRKVAGFCPDVIGKDDDDGVTRGHVPEC